MVLKRPEDVRAATRAHDLQGDFRGAQASLLVVLAATSQCLTPGGAGGSQMNEPDQQVLYPSEHEAQDARARDVEPIAMLELEGAACEQPRLANGT